VNDTVSRLLFMRTDYPEIRKVLDVYENSSVNILISLALFKILLYRNTL
jgi:hypothetical protein